MRNFKEQVKIEIGAYLEVGAVCGVEELGEVGYLAVAAVCAVEAVKQRYMYARVG